MGDEYEDNTDNIRALNHSACIKRDVVTMVQLKQEAAESPSADPDALRRECETKCAFLFSKYTDIFNRMLADTIDVGIMYQTLGVLSKIENGTIDQEQGSVEMGKLLHSLYVDSAVRNADKLNATSDAANAVAKPTSVAMTYSEYKHRMSTIKSKLTHATSVSAAPIDAVALAAVYAASVSKDAASVSKASTKKHKK